MKYVIKYNDGKGDLFFSRLGMWNAPVFVTKIKFADARRFETRQSARQWINGFLGGSQRYTIVEEREVR